MNIITIFTCHNRLKHTQNCIDAIWGESSNDKNISFVIVDDNSSDGTKEDLLNEKEKKRIYVIEGNGELYYSGAMNVGMNYVLTSNLEYDYVLLVNDDVKFKEGFLGSLVNKSNGQYVIVGTTVPTGGNMKLRPRTVINEWGKKLDISSYVNRNNTGKR